MSRTDSTTRKEGEALIRLSTGDRTAPEPSATHRQRSPRAARLALLAIPVLLLAAVSTARADGVATVLPPDGLHLRAVPSTQGVSLGVIPGGTRVALTGAAADGWYPAVFLGKRGWLRAEFVDVPGDATTLTRRATVRATAGLLLRDEPHAAADALATMPNGATITASARTTSDNWVMVAVGGLIGWASADFLQFDTTMVPAAIAPPPTATAPTTAGVRGTITYYHPSLEGGAMACGGRYRAEDPTIAAATSWPCGTKLRVCRNAACVVVTVQDTGRMGPNWVDLSAAAFRQLGSLPEMMIFGSIEVAP